MRELFTAYPGTVEKSALTVTSDSLPTMMPNVSPKGIGGEYGAVRANIDIDKLNAYLAAHVPAVCSPVDVQQFKVCFQSSLA